MYTSHCTAQPNAQEVEQEGFIIINRQICAVRCAAGIRGRLCGERLQEVYRARDAPEPPRLPEPSTESRGGVRVRLQRGPTLCTLRRVRLRRSAPSRDSLRRTMPLLHGVSESLGFFFFSLFFFPFSFGFLCPGRGFRRQLKGANQRVVTRLSVFSNSVSGLY